MSIPSTITRIVRSRNAEKGPSFPGHFKFTKPRRRSGLACVLSYCPDEAALLKLIDRLVGDPAFKLTVSFTAGDVFAVPAEGLGQSRHVLTFARVTAPR